MPKTEDPFETTAPQCDKRDASDDCVLYATLVDALRGMLHSIRSTCHYDDVLADDIDYLKSKCEKRYFEARREYLEELKMRDGKANAKD